MNDYLGNLAGRSLNRMPVLQPRLASIFEPPAAKRGAVISRVDLEDDFFREPIQGFTVPTLASFLKPLTPPKAESSVKTAETQTVSAPRNEAWAGRPELSPVASRLPESLVPMVTRVETVSTPLSSTSVRPHSPPQELAKEKTEVIVEKKTLITIEPQAPTPKMEGVTHSKIALPGESLPRGTSPQVISRPPASALPDRLEVTPRKTVALSSKPSPEPMRSRSEQSLPTLAPTIRVTIGRVEVRAIMPSMPVATSRQAPPHQPALTLEEYLKQRNGEGN